MIHIKNLNKYYHKGKTNEIHVINNTSITLEDTGLICILGESGSGKTTLMNTISGLDDFHDGEMEIDGVKIKKYGERKQERVRDEKFGYIFQNYYLLQDRTVEYNIMLALSLYNISEEEKEERIDYVLRAVDMWKYKKRLISQLSGGQQQRIAIARALAKAPKVIFADEPTGNLDEKNTMRIMGILKKISQTCLVVVVTHEKSIADFFADKILWITDGVIEKQIDKKKDASYEYVEDTNIYLQEYEKTEVSEDNVKLEVYANEEVPPAEIKIIYEHGKIYIYGGDSKDLVFLSRSDEKKLVDSKKPVIDIKEAEEADYSLEHIEGAKKPKMGAREIMDIARTNIKALGKKQIFLVFTLIAMAVLTILIMQDTLSILRIDEQALSTVDSHYYKVTAEKNAMITDNEFTNYFSQMTQNFEDKEIDANIVPVITFNYQYKGYQQLETESYEVSGFSLVPLDKVSEADLVYGRMPENDQEIVIDRWVLENFMTNCAGIENVMTNIRQALGSKITNFKGMDYTIVGISETNEPTIYVDRDTMVLMTSSYVNFLTDSKAAEIYEDYEGGDLGVMENGKIKVLVDSNTLQTQYRKYLMQNYSILEDLKDRIAMLEIAALDAGKGHHYMGYSSDEAAEYLPYLRQEYEDTVAELGMTYEEYEGKLNNSGEYAGAFLDYSYEGLLTETMRYVVTGRFPTSYGIDFIISDDSCQFMAKTIMDKYKQCYVYIDENIGVDKAIQTIKDAIPEETAKNLTVSIVNEYQDTIDKYDMEKRQKLGARILMMVTIIVITMVILYFMMKANAVSRMQDLGVYRMLGISKKSIIGMFAYENFLITTRTSVVGALITIFISYVIAKIPSAEYEFYYPWYLFLATIFVIYLFNILIGILPIRKMLKLPPAQLAAKYDI